MQFLPDFTDGEISVPGRADSALECWLSHGLCNVHPVVTLFLHKKSQCFHPDSNMCVFICGTDKHVKSVQLKTFIECLLYVEHVESTGIYLRIKIEAPC